MKMPWKRAVAEVAGNNDDDDLNLISVDIAPDHTLQTDCESCAEAFRQLTRTWNQVRQAPHQGRDSGTDRGAWHTFARFLLVEASAIGWSPERAVQEFLQELMECVPGLHARIKDVTGTDTAD